MPRQSYYSLVMRTYLLHMVLRDLISPGEDVDDAAKQLESDLKILQGIKMLQFNSVGVEIHGLRPEVIAEGDKVLVHYRSRTNVR